MNGAVDDKPRMTAADADARFAALVAEHRAAKPSRRAGTAFARGDDRLSGIAVLLVYCLGVVGGSIWHVKPLTAIIVGVPALLVVRHLLKRWRDRVAEA